MGQELLKIENASCGRGLHFQIREINLTLESGTVMGIIGRNGSGKSTLFHMLCGWAPVYKGKVWICGEDLSENPKACKKVIGTVMDDNYFRVGFSVKNAGKLYGKYYESYSQEAFLNYCNKFGVNTKALVTKLSKGEYMKFQLAFALAHEPKLLLMDEPDAGLDPIFRKEWKDILFDITGEDRSILIATHLLEELEQYADYVTLFCDGKQEFTLSVPEIQDNYRIIRGSEKQIELLEGTMIGKPRQTDMYVEGLYSMENGPVRFPMHEERPNLEEIMYYFNSKSEKRRKGA